ncbi:hypothetical protein KP509_02G044500 [Ceratopteris richardii]|nr:hypothetical protein KP509_02G044500 [Ceratopteris richardii]
MYAKCGVLEKAQEVFDEAPIQNTVTWNILIAGYAQHEHSKEALEAFIRMKAGGFQPDAFTFSSILRACSRLGALDIGSEIHEQIRKENLLEKDIVLGNGLIDMYTKCGALERANEVFSQLSKRNLVSWNTLIAGYSHQGRGREALDFYEQMLCGGFSPDAVTFVCTLQACGSIGALQKGQELHAQIIKENSDKTNAAVANALVDMYMKCGAVLHARGVFEDIPFRNLVLWTVLIAGYAQHGYGKDALDCYKQMQFGGFLPDAATLSCVLKACTSIGALDSGCEIHAQIVREHSLETNSIIANALIDMYSKCGALEKAEEVFKKLLYPDNIAWTALIGGYSQHKQGGVAMQCFERMQLESHSPDEVTYACCMKACGSIKALGRGQQIHAQIIRLQSLEKHQLLFNSMIDMYSKCGVLDIAKNVFDGLTNRNVVSWNALLSGLTQHGYSRDAVKLYEQMLSRSISPDATTYACVLKAYGDIGDFEKGHEIASHVIKQQLLKTNIVVANALIDMYLKCGEVKIAREVFDEIPVRDVILWTSMITGYADHGYGEDAISCFEHMKVEGLYPDAITFAAILKACGSMGAAYTGEDVHSEIVKQELLEHDAVIGIALVNFYANCGMLAEAQWIFDELPERNVISWSALMVGYAQLGKEDVVLHMLDMMVAESIEPDAVTFTIILNTCSHRGLLDLGQMYFESIHEVFGILPTIEHYTIMVDLFGRAGHLDRAVAIIERLPVSVVNLTMWHTLLGACNKLANTNLGMWAFEQLHEVDAAAYVCLSNIFSVTNQINAEQPPKQTV